VFRKSKEMLMLARDTLLRAALAAAFLTAPGISMTQIGVIPTRPATFTNTDVVLTGDLYLPAQHPPLAGLVLVHGAGPTKRMERTAAMLAAAGFAVLTYDKRGAGQSGGIYEATYNTSRENLALLAGDASAALQWLQDRPELANRKSGFWGISQAGWIIPIAAVQSGDADFMVMWSGPVCTVIEELEAGIGNGGNLSDDATVQAMIAEWRAEGRDTDPRDALAMLDIPALWMFGGKDDTLPVSLSIERLEGLVDAGQTNFEYRLDPDGGHGLKLPDDEPRVEEMIAWMKQQASL
jgi:pimeloyl-ACP methyl ester carboxylesterase